MRKHPSAIVPQRWRLRESPGLQRALLLPHQRQQQRWYSGAWRYLAVLSVLVFIAPVALARMQPMTTAVRSQAPVARFHGAVAEPPLAVPSVTLTDEREETVRLTDYRGEVVLLYFGYTNCPDACPMALSTLARARGALEEDGERVRVLFITVDPERDTPERLASFVHRFDPTFAGLTGAPEALARVFQAFGVAAEKATHSDSTAAYDVAHASLTYVVDQQNRLRLAYPPTVNTADIAADVRILLGEDRK